MRVLTVLAAGVASVILLLFGYGCGGAETALPEAVLAGAGVPGLAELNAIAPAPRWTAGTYHFNGDDALFWDPAITPADPLDITAPAGEATYAIYGALPVNEVSAPLTLVLNLDGSSGTVWVGLSNYTQGKWDWQAVEAPFSTWMEVAVPASGDEYFSAGESLYFCLLVHDGDTLHFEGANLETQNHWLINPASWQDHLIAEGANFGKHHAACLLENGAPGIVYTRDDTEKIYFAYATTPTPSAAGDWVSHVADSGSDRGGSVDICMGLDTPSIVYEDVNRQDVYYAYSQTALPTAESDWVSHQPDANATSQPRLQQMGGDDCLVYRAFEGLKFAHALVNDPAGAADWETAIVDSGTGVTFDFLQIAMNFSGPVVAYKRLEGGQTYLYFAWSDALDGGNLLDFNTVVVDDTNTNNGNNVQLTLGSDGRAWIAYTNVDVVHYLRFARANIEKPTTMAHFTKMDVFGQEQTHVGQYMGLNNALDRPLISFIETGSGAVEGVHAMYPNRELEQLNGPESFDHTLLYDPEASELVNEQTEVLILSNGYPAVIFRTNLGLHFSYFPASAAP
jgi:hypothetical protein